MSNHQIWDWYPFPRIHVFTNRKKSREFIKRKFDQDIAWLGKSAQTDYFSKGGEESQAVITLCVDDESAAQKAATIAHECSHVIDSWLEDIGEDSPGEEIRAYAVQCAVLTVLEQLGEEWLIKTPQTSKSSTE